MVGLSLQPKDVPEQPPLRLSPWLYGPPNYMFYSLNNSNSTGNHILNTMIYPPGPGYRCMDQNPFDDLTCASVSPFDRYSGAKTYSDVNIDNSKCICSNESNYKCPFSAYEPQPPTKLSDTTDHLVNLTMLNITQWLLMTEKLYRKQRYGGFSLGEINPVANENIDYRLVDENLNILSALLANFSTIFRLDWKNAPRISPETDILPVNESASTLPVEWFKMNFTRQLALLLNGMEVKRNVKVWFNNQGWAALPSYVNVLSNAILRSNLPQEKWSEYGIVVYNHPMNYSSNQQGQRIAYGFNIGAELTAAVMIILAFSVIPASFVLFLIDERSSDAKHLHLVSGVAPNIYWLANFAWDLTNFFIPVVGVMLVFFIFDQVAYIGWFRNALAAFLLLYIYGYATIPIMYLFTFLFRVPSVAFIWLATGNLFFGWVTTTVTSMLEILGQDDAFLIKINNYLMMVFLVIPQYSLGRGMLDMKLQYFLYKGEEFAFGQATPADPFAWKFLGRNMLSLFIEGTLAFILVLFIENYKWKAQRTEMLHERNVSQQSEEDDDVKNERIFVMGPKSTQSAIRIVNLTKEYQTSNILKRIICCTCCKRTTGENSSLFRAVDRLCFTVQNGECFGLLGVNGAGKTSTFNMLTGKIRVSSGDAFISQKSVLSDRDTVRKNIGFCPQFDALNPLLTAREQVGNANTFCFAEFEFSHFLSLFCTRVYVVLKRRILKM
uniref:ABC transporter domain-containing protein n=1 Tax=Romanomermis culicivorax TaxID=13658 RepID=A0A915KZX7_ROMCU